MDLKDFQKFGQSVWLDYLRRNLIESGELRRLVSDDGIRGITTNPKIFEQAIADSDDYDDDVGSAAEPAAAIYERLVLEDIQRAADLLRPVFDSSGGRDGFISMEVSPYLAHDTAATIDEARRLWRELGRENVMIKVPGTEEGFPAIEQLTSEGINVNITLLFGREACRRVHEAYMAGLEKRLAAGEAIDRIASVASMFVSRVDALVAKELRDRESLRDLAAKVGIANAKLAYADWKRTLAGPRWGALAARGARPQRLLWASTSTKDPALPDVLYVEALIGPDTIDTIPPSTLDALRDHGVAAEHLEEDLDESRAVMARLENAGISIEQLAATLVEDGIQKFATAFTDLLTSIDKKRSALLEKRAVS